MKARLCSKREVWEITEWKDGCIYKTVNTGRFIWIPIEDKTYHFKQDGRDYLLVTPSDLDMPQYRKDWVDTSGPI